jgi:hypothetical protein
MSLSPGRWCVEPVDSATIDTALQEWLDGASILAGES